MTNCYYYKVINETASPILQNLELTVLLVMEDSKRFKPNDFILNLAKKTIIQYNKGYKECPKMCGHNKIDISWKDINYSNLTALNYFKHDYSNVLILEEDAEPFNKNITHDHLTEINKYISNPDFNVISLGSTCFFLPTKNKYIKSCASEQIGGAQAVIWNLNDIDTFSNKIIETSCSKGHWDNQYLPLSNTNIFYKPIIVQKFPQTENRKSWTSGVQGYLQGKLFDMYDTENKTDIWEILYFLCDNWYAMVILVIFLILYFINYKK